MKLTKEQSEAISRGEEVPVKIEGTECVVIRRDVYVQAIKTMREAHPGDLSEADLRQILARAYEASDWNDPEMDIYNDYDNAKK
ncbi:hypothetical protein [uncultured Gimesia sp.]|jgi:hypothetical protein|uniref:hypothetical protein n=1 Tax=uncultured Gimesia sp. TaxID=1678688 RepID=UPI00262B538C|nr:hypothetical protein [uncultured Gimesia sp.]